MLEFLSLIELKDITKSVVYLKHIKKNVKDEETKEIIKENLDGLTKALKERIAEEKMKMDNMETELNL